MLILTLILDIQLKIWQSNKEILMNKDIEQLLNQEFKNFNCIYNDIWKVIDFELNGKLTKDESDYLFKILKKHIENGGRLSIFCIGLLSDILDSDWKEYLLNLLKMNLDKSEAISLKIIQVLDSNSETDYLELFNDKVKNKLSKEFSNFIDVLLKFYNGEYNTIHWPQIFYKDDSEEIKILWK